MKYMVTVFAMVVALVYGSWLFALEASMATGPMVTIEKAGASMVACVFLGIFLLLAIFEMSEKGEEIYLPDGD